MKLSSQLDLLTNTTATIRTAFLALAIGLTNCNKSSSEPNTISIRQQITNCTHTESHGGMPYGKPWPFQFRVSGENLPADIQVHVFQTIQDNEREVFTGIFSISKQGIVNVQVPFDKFTQNARTRFSVSLPTQLGSGIVCKFPHSSSLDF